MPGFLVLLKPTESLQNGAAFIRKLEQAGPAKKSGLGATKRAVANYARAASEPVTRLLGERESR